MTSSIAAQIVGLGGLPGPAQSIQNAIRAQLLGVDLSAFSPGQNSTEAVVRRDPGAANATLTFMKSGQTMALPLELAKTLIGQIYGSAQIAIEITARDEQGTISATLSKINPTLASISPNSEAINPNGFAQISAPGKLLSEASFIPLATPKQWLNAITVLLSTPLSPPPAAEILAKLPASMNPNTPDAQSSIRNNNGLEMNRPAGQTDQATSASVDLVQHIAAKLSASLANVPAGAGVGYERTLAHASTLGPEMAAEVLSTIQKFPQSSSLENAHDVQWTAQQAKAAEQSEIMWQGQAWQGAPAWLAMGTRPNTSEMGNEVFARLGTSAPEFCSWIRLRISPPGLGPIDLWAAILSSSRCHARLRAHPASQQTLDLALSAFGTLLESARVDLRIDYEAVESIDE